MTATGRATRRGKTAVVAVSGGILAIIWSGVWYAAMTTGRLEASANARTGCQVLCVGGLATAVVGFLYLRANRLSVVDGSTTELHTPLPMSAETAVSQPLSADRARV